MAVSGGVGLRVEELVLHGFEPRDRLAIAAAVERELGRLLLHEREPARFAGGGAHRLDGGSFEVPRGAAPALVGAEIARAIHGGLGGAAR